MNKGTRRALNFVTRTDPDTGARVTRLTPPTITCHRNYFYQKCFTADGGTLIFGAEFGPGPHWNYHELDLTTGTATQLTEGAGENTFGGFLSPNDAFLYFVRGERELVRLHRANLSEEVVYRVPEGWVGYGTWVANSACTRMVGIEIHADDWFELDDWAKFTAMFHARPRCRLIRIDLASGVRDVLFERQGWLGHPQYRPGDDNTVAYCHEGPSDLIDARMWFVDEDGRNRRCAHVHAPGERCTHEFWVPDGSAMLYVSIRSEDAPDQRRLCSIDPVTLENSELLAIPPCSHLMSNRDGSLVVGDGSGEDPYLHLIDLRAGTHHRIARHDTSWRVHKGNRQVTHPHPSFTPNDRAVLYTSDAEGEPALYLAELPNV